jgi:hypothetical protein
MSKNHTRNDGGAIYCENGSAPVLINNILHINMSDFQVFIADNSSAPKMLNNINESGTLGIAEGVTYNWDNYGENFDIDPQFVDPWSGNYRLKATSPAINKGIDPTGLSLPTTDLDGNPRIFDSAIDLGCYEYQDIVGIEETRWLETLFTLYPNPVSNTLYIETTNNTTPEVKIYSMQGALLIHTKGNQIDISALLIGIYIAEIDGVSRKIVKQ